MNQGSLMCRFLVLLAFYVNFGAANSEQAQTQTHPLAPVPVEQVYSVASPHPHQVPPPTPVAVSVPLLPPVYQQPVDTWLTFPPVYVPDATTTVVDAPPRLRLFCPRRCFININRFGREVCRCPQRRNDNNFDLLLALSLFGRHSTSTPPSVDTTPTSPYE